MGTNVTWPGGSTGVTVDTYTIPAVSETYGTDLSNFLIALGQGAQTTTFQKFAVSIGEVSPISVLTTDCVIVCDLLIAGPVVVNLPQGQNKQVYFISDGKGDAGGTNNITINAFAGDTIKGGASVSISTNNGCVMIVFNASDNDWKIIIKI